MKRRNWIQAVTLTTAGALMNSRLLGQSKSGGSATQPSTDDRAYTNSGSLYTASLSFLPLGLPPTHAFWSDAAAQWSSQKAFAGLPFPKDYYVTY